MILIMKRDFQSYFHTPVGYVFMGVFLSLSGLIFYLSNIQSLSGDLLSFLPWLTYLIMLLAPLLTMRLICEERQKRTDQLLLTAPVSLASLVVGKFLAAAAVVLLTVFLTNIYTLIIAICGKVYWGEWFVGYLGFTLQSLCFLAVDLLVTCFTRHQMIGAAVAIGANFVLYILDLVADQVSSDIVSSVLSFLSLYDRYQSFLLGQLSFADVLFFLTFIMACLVLSVRVLDSRRFSAGGVA